MATSETCLQRAAHQTVQADDPHSLQAGDGYDLLLRRCQQEKCLDGTLIKRRDTGCLALD